jgi:hypothetical protein
VLNFLHMWGVLLTKVNSWSYMGAQSEVIMKNIKEINCPFCEKKHIAPPHYVHTTKVTLSTGDDDYECQKALSVDHELQVSIEDPKSIQSWHRQRELDIILHCYCEIGGHSFLRKLFFHKGNTYEEWVLINGIQDEKNIIRPDFFL